MVFSSSFFVWRREDWDVEGFANLELCFGDPSLPPSPETEVKPSVGNCQC